MSLTLNQTQPMPTPAPSPQWSQVTSLRDKPEWFVEAWRSLTRISGLRDAWDGEDALAPRREAIASAVRVISELEPYYELPLVHIGPSLDGGLSLEWRNNPRDLNLDILPDGSIEYLKAEKTAAGFDVNAMEEGSLAFDRIREIRPLVMWLMHCA
jgi:hypothetical protein